MRRRDDDFIVDDEGFGYKDRGGEIWETGENNTDAAKKSKKRKLNVSLSVSLTLKSLIEKAVKRLSKLAHISSAN